MTAGPITTEAEAIRRMQALARYYQEHPLEVFEPSPALVGFMADPSKRILVRAASRVGKSRTAAARLSREMLDHPGSMYRAVGVTYRQSIDVVGKYLHEFLPAESLAPGCRYSKKNGWTHQLVHLKNGASCQIRSQDQKVIAHAGPEFNGVWLDEPPPSDIFEENLARVRSLDGWVWVTATPLGRPVEWFRAVVEAPGSGWVQHVIPLSHANCPWYTPKQVDDWIAEARNYPDSFKQRIEGAWEGITLERVYTGYDSSCHVSDLSVIPKHAKWGVGIDHGEGIGKQVAVLIAWDDRTSHTTRIWLVDEYVSTTRSTPEQDATAIRAMLKRRDLDVHNIDRWVGDTNSAGKLGAGETINQALSKALAKEAGFHRPPRSIENAIKGPVKFGEQLVNAGFLRRQIFVYNANLPRLCQTLSHYNGEDDLKHASDALRYILYPILDKSSMPSIGSVSLGLR